MKVRTYARTSPEENQRERDHRDLARRISEEGIVLLKNDGALPVAPGNIALYGAGVTKTIFGGTGSGEVNARKYVNVLEGFENAGYRVTTKRWLDDYEADFKAKEDAFFDEMRSAFTSLRGVADANNVLGKSFIYPYGRDITEQDIADSDTDTCIYVISRQSGEGTDRKPEEFVFLPGEIAQIRLCTERYAKTILVINVGSSMDLTGVADLPGLNAIVYMCQLGEESGTALANVISGKVSPSGHLSDTWVQNYAQVPFGDKFSAMSPEPLEQNYEEGIYVGYRYYQTAGVTPRYPFGFGLSYTTFSYEVKSVEHFQSFVTTKVKVTNTGDTYSGKAVVQEYLSCPTGTLQKPYQQLVAYAKTPDLGPGQASEVELRFDLRDETSYDDATQSYILEAGDYLLFVGDSSVAAEPAAVIELPETVTVENTKPIDRDRTVREIELPANRPALSGDVPRLTLASKDIHPIRHTFEPDRQWNVYKDIVSNLSMVDAVELVLGKGMHFFAFKGSFTVPGNAANTTPKLMKNYQIPTVSLADGPAGLRILEESVQYPNGTIKPLKNAISVFDYLPEKASKLLLGNRKFGKVLYQYATAFPVGTAVAQTWNVDLAEAFGAAVSTEMSEYGVTFWLAPGMNIHRNPLCGRNFEYYSEDPMLTGSIAAAVCKGVASRPGNYVTIKHFCANNQEFQRNKASSNVSERALREIYLRPFKRAIRDGEAKAVMTSYNPMNGIYNVNNKSLLEDFLRGECGFDGIVMTDWTSTTPGMASPVGAIQAGNDMIMPGMFFDRIPLLLALRNRTLDPTDLQRCATRIVKVLLESEQGKERIRERKLDRKR
ncbi:MAG: glycoside hydrolase family 3 C-terminal domain-containing protein [Clostridia bacterium]|nr:glycoside hydrolase family 3 C-terminal domain-containing protein [Clostridia bacterium]